MTALAAYWNFRKVVDLDAHCRAILRAQGIYAPGPDRVWNNGNLGLGRRLHRSLPEDAYDTGLVVGGGGRWTLAADVRLDNRPELAASLGIDLHDTASLADSAFVMKAVERWEEAAFTHLIGDFALVLWDRDRARLLLARDFLGLRPLHYHIGSDFAAVASMPKGLHGLSDVPRELDEEKCAEFLALLPEHDDRTFFRGISRVVPGQCVTIDANGVQAREWWSFRPKTLGLCKPQDYEEAVREAMETAVAARLRGASNRVAAHLSGGLDSGTVVATAALQLGGHGQVLAYTAVPRQGFAGWVPHGRIADEGPLARTVAERHSNVDHVLVEDTQRSPLDALDRNFFLHERPVLNLCNHVWSDTIFDLVKKEGVPVLLIGQMGNASFSYSGMEMLAQLLAHGRVGRLLREALLLRRGGHSLQSLAAHSAGPFLPRVLWRTISALAGRTADIGEYTVISDEMLPRLLRKATERRLDFTYRPWRDPVAARLCMLRRFDFGNSRKAAIGGWGIDVRDPTADRRLVELCLSMPPEQFLFNGTTRALARSAFADRLPTAIIAEKRSGYQAAGWYEGLGAAEPQVAAEVEAIARAPAAGRALNLAKLQSLATSLPAAGQNGHISHARYRLALLRGISVGHFIRRAQGAN